jgi:RecB family exonuclease
MSLIPPVINISTEDEVLMRRGALEQNSFSETLWNGQFVLDTDVKKIILRRFGPASFCRVTDMEAYRQCPLRFYIERFLNLERYKAPKYEVEARVWGRLAHKTMEYLFEETNVQIEMLDEKLFLALERALKDLSLGSFWADVARRIFQKVLPLLKESEKSLRMKGFRPYILEKNLRVKVNGLGLKGKVDRIDIKEIKNKKSRIKISEENPVILLDYKTGSIDRNSLQLPLYACMWQAEHSEPVVQTGFYSLRNGQIEYFPKKTDIESYMLGAIQEAEEIVTKIRGGKFSPAPYNEGMCRLCSHSDVCIGAK